MRDRLIEDLKGFRTPICEGLNAKIPYAEELADYLLEKWCYQKLIEQYKNKDAEQIAKEMPEEEK